MAFSQELKLTVVDEDGLVLSNYFLSKNSENQQLVSKEEFVLKVKLGDTVLVKKTGYNDRKYDENKWKMIESCSYDPLKNVWL